MRKKLKIMNNQLLESMADLTTIVGFPIACLTIYMTWREYVQTKKVAEGTLLLELKNTFLEFDDIHLGLRPGGIWTIGNRLFSSEDWIRVETYMGLFELCEILISNQSISEKNFKDQYLFRLHNILNNEEIVNFKLNHEKEYWQTFIALCRRFELQIPEINE
ncbi:MAG: hypothetical protein RL609_1467 [Bacteroidota bacterium]